MLKINQKENKYNFFQPNKIYIYIYVKKIKGSHICSKSSY